MAFDYQKAFDEAAKKVYNRNKYEYIPKTAMEAANPAAYRALHNVKLKKKYGDTYNEISKDHSILNKYVNDSVSGIYDNYSSKDYLAELDTYQGAYDRYRRNIGDYRLMGQALGYEDADDTELNSWLDYVGSSLSKERNYATIDYRGINDRYKNTNDLYNISIGKDQYSQKKMSEYIDSVDDDISYYTDAIKYLDDNKDAFSTDYDALHEMYQTGLNNANATKQNLENKKLYLGQFEDSEGNFDADTADAFEFVQTRFPDATSSELLDKWYEYDQNNDDTQAWYLTNYIKRNVTEDEFNAWYNEKHKGSQHVYNTFMNTTWGSSIPDYEVAKNVDFTSYKSVSDEIEKRKDDYNLVTGLYNSIVGDPELAKGEVNALKSLQSKVYDGTSEGIQEFLSDVKRYAPAYYEYWLKGISEEDFIGGDTIFAEADRFKHTVIPGVIANLHISSSGIDFANEYQNDKRDFADKEYMDNEQRAKYLYLLDNYGEDEAEAFRYTIQDSINRTKGEMTGETVQDIDEFLPVANEIYNLFNGFKSFFVNTSRSLGKDIGTTASEYATQYIINDITENGSDFERYANLAANTIGNQIPRMIISSAVGMMTGGLGATAGVAKTIGNIAGTVAMANSARGAAYKEARDMGFNRTEAGNYAAAIAVAEGVTSSVLSGISGIGGNVVKKLGAPVIGKLTSTMGAFNNALVKTIANYTFDAVSEGFEEGLQAILEPMLQNAILGTDNEVDISNPEVLESALLGAISAMVLNLPGTVSSVKGAVNTEKAKKRIDTTMYNTSTELGRGNLNYEINRVKELVNSKAIDKSSPLAQKALVLESKLEKGRNIGDSEISAFLLEMDNTVVSESSAIADSKYAQYRSEDIKGSYGGVSFNDVPNLIAMGESMKSDGTFTKADEAIFGGETVFENTFDELKRAYDDNSMKPEQAKQLYDMLYDAQGVTSDKDAWSKERFGVSETEKVKVDGANVKADGINPDTGKVTLSDGNEADIENVTFSNQNEAQVYTTAADMGGVKGDLYASIYNGTSDVKTYDLLFNGIYHDGRYLNNSDFAKTWNDYKEHAEGIMSEDAARMIFEAAVDQKTTERNKSVEKAFIKKGVAKGEVKGTFVDLDKDTFAHAIATRFGANVEITDIENGANAQFDRESGTIRLNRNTKRITQGVVHEMMEAVLAYHANSALEIQDAIISFLNETKGKDFTEEKIELYRKKYAKSEKSKTTNEAKAELTNDMVGQLFATEEGFKEFTDWLLDTEKVDTEQKKHLLKSIKEIIGNVIDFFKKLLDVAPMNEATATVVDMELERAKAIRKMALEAFDKVSETLAEGNVEGEAETSKGEVKNSIEVNDEAYMDAVNRGDMETAQKMVDEAAKNAGHTINAYHGTNSNFYVFDKGRVGKGNDQYGAGFYFASDKNASKHYGNRVIDAALKIKKPFAIASTNLLNADVTFTDEQAYEIIKRHPKIYDSEESPLGDYYDSYWEGGAEEWMLEDLARQYTDLGLLDSDLFRYYPNELHEAVRDVTGHDGIVVNLPNNEKFYVAWFDNQIKSAEPVTYDDNGNVIPLSERFDESKTDIRNSIEVTDEITKVEVDALRSISKAYSGKRVSVNRFNESDIKKSIKFAERYFKQIRTKSPFFRAWFGDWRAYSKDDAFIVDTESDQRKTVKNLDTGWEIQTSKKIHKETNAHASNNVQNARKYLPYIDDITKKAILFDSFISNKENENSLMYHSLYAYTEVFGYPALLKLQVEELYYYSNTESGIIMRDYILQNIEEESLSKRNRFSRPNREKKNSSTISISNLFNLVKEYDRNFMPNPIHPSALNDDGTPKLFYHGSQNEFEIFDRGKAKKNGLYGSGFYFTDSDTQANVYGNKYTVYLSYANPVMEGENTLKRNDVKKFLEAVAENEDYSIENYGTYNVDEILDMIFEDSAEKDTYAVLNDINATAIGDFVETVEFYNEVLKTDFDAIVVPTETVVFKPTQIKSATDNKGTFSKYDANMRNSLEVNEHSYNRELLADALEGVAKTDKETELLSQYKGRLDKISEAEREIAELRKTNDADAKKKIKSLTSMIDRQDRRLLELEEMGPIKDILTRERNRIATEYRKKPITKEKHYTAEKLEARNEMISLLKNQVRYLSEGGTALNQNAVKRLASNLIKEASSNLDLSSVSNILYGIYDDMAHKDMSIEDARERIEDVANAIVANAKTTDNEVSERLSNIRDILKGGISLTADQKANVKSQYEDTEGFKKALGISVNVNNSATSLDTLWGSLNEAYPDLFPLDTKLGDQPALLAEVTSTLKSELEYNPIERAYNGDVDMAAEDYVARIIDEYYSIPEIRNKAAEKYEKLKAKEERARAILKEQYTAKLQNQRENLKEQRAREKELNKLKGIYDETLRWLTKPTREERKCPDVLAVPYAEFLEGIDFSSAKRLKGKGDTRADVKWVNSLDKLKTVIENITKAQDPTNQDQAKFDGFDEGYLDLPQDFVARLNEMISGIRAQSEKGTFTLNEMSSSEIKELHDILKELNHGIKDITKLHNNYRFKAVGEAARSSIEFLNELGLLKGTGKVREYLNWGNVTPINVFDRFGEGGQSIFTELMDAQDTLAYRSKDILDFKERTWKDSEVKNLMKETHVVKLSSGENMTITTAQAMSVYCLANRDNEQGVRHMTGGGVTVEAVNKITGKGNDKGFVLTRDDIRNIIKLTEGRPREIADAIQEFMSNTCAEWGNEVTMKRYLRKAFNEKKYFPIESDSLYLRERDPAAKQTDLFRLLNISATFNLNPMANNRIMVRNIFDVFAEHSSDMAKMNAYGIALIDTMKWLNYKEKVSDTVTIGVRPAMRDAFGDAPRKYIIDLIKDINGKYNDVGYTAIIDKLSSAVKVASVGGNLRVALLQFTAAPRAGVVLSQSSMIAGNKRPPQISKARQYCGIALWKSLGFYDTKIAREVERRIKGGESWIQVLREYSLKGAEIADAITWGYLWNCCESEIAKTRKDLAIGSEEFNKTVGIKLREVIYRTQVVDSPLTKSQIMRSKSDYAKMYTSFMSEPTVIYNIAKSAQFKFKMDVRAAQSKGKSAASARASALKNNADKLVKTLGILVVSNALTSAVEAAFDSIRDDDDDRDLADKYLENFRKAFIENMNPLEKIPLVKEFTDPAMYIVHRLFPDLGIGLEYYSATSTFSGQTLEAVASIFDTLGSDKATTYGKIFSGVDLVSKVSGLPLANITRDITSFHNTAVQAEGKYGDKLRRKEQSLTSYIANAYEQYSKGDKRDMAAFLMLLEDEKEKDVKKDYPNMPKDILNTETNEEVKRVLLNGIKKQYREAYANDSQTKIKQIFDFLKATGVFEDDDEITESLKGLRIKEKNTDWYDTSEGKFRKFEDLVDKNESKKAQKHIEGLMAERVDEALSNAGYTKTEYEANNDLKKLIDDKAKSSLQSSFTTRYKQQYLDAYEAEDTKAIKYVKKMLLNSGLYGDSDSIVETFNEWRKEDLKSKYEMTYILGDEKQREEIRQIFIDSGTFESKKKVDEQLERWLEKIEDEE